MLQCSPTLNRPNANLINSSSVGSQYRALQIVSLFARHRYLGLYRPPHSKLYWNPLGFMKHSFPPSSIPSSSPIWQVTSSHSVLDLTIAGSLLHQTAPFPPAGHPLWRDITLLLLLEWPLYWGCPFEPEGAFHWNCLASNIQSNLHMKILLPPNAFQEKVHMEVIARFTVCFFSFSTSVRRSDFSFNSLRQDAVSRKTTTSILPSTLRFRTAYLYASGSEDPLNII